jgi:hypothetical protein
MYLTAGDVISIILALVALLGLMAVVLYANWQLQIRNTNQRELIYELLNEDWDDGNGSL